MQWRLVLIVILIAVVTWPLYETPADGGILYSAAKLIGSSNPYDKDQMCAEEAKIPAIKLCLGVARLPWYFAVLKPLTWFSFPVFRWIWLLINAAAFIAFIWLWPDAKYRWWALISGAFWDTLHHGQDITIYLLCATCAMLALREDRPQRAGLFLALCTMKFNLGIIIALVLLVKRQWRAIGYAALFTALLLVISGLVQGFDFPLQIWRGLPFADNYIFWQPSIRALAMLLPKSRGVELLLSGMVMTAVWIVSRREDWPMCFAISLPAAMLVGRHAGSYDTLLFVPLFWELSKRGIRSAWLLLLCPYLFLVGESHYFDSTRLPGIARIYGVIPVLVYFAVQAGVVSLRRHYSGPFNKVLAYL